jgi:hypothetical protein
MSAETQPLRNWQVRNGLCSAFGQLENEEIFLKNLQDSLSLMTTYRMSLISTGSISLDSTFDTRFPSGFKYKNLANNF